MNQRDNLQRFDSADWAMSQQEQKHKDADVVFDEMDEEVDFDEEPPECVKQVPVAVTGARVTAQRLLSKHSTGSSSGGESSPPQRCSPDPAAFKR